MHSSGWTWHDRPASCHRWRVNRRRLPANVTALSVVVAGDEPPAEFRLFTAGTVETSIGTFIFDEDAAARVMATYAEQGNELMIDYDHASFANVALDPAQSGKAAGWFNLELRNGELWAVNVRWTEPAAEALRRKEWRYTSPTFASKDGRILKLVNVALTNIPATKRLEPLMAASQIVALNGGSMNAELVKKLLDAIEAGDLDALKELAKDLVASAASGEPPPSDEPADAPPDMAGDAPAADDGEAMKAASAKLMRLTGKTTLHAALEDVEVFRDSHVALTAEREKLAKERAALETSERRKLVGELVKLGVEIPATAWKDSKGSVPCKRLQDEPLPELRERVQKLSAARGGSAPKAPTPPSARPSNGADTGEQEVSTPLGVVKLSAREIQTCKEVGAKLEDYAANKAIHEAAKRGGSQ